MADNNSYNFKGIEAKWDQAWQERGLFQSDNSETGQQRNRTTAKQDNSQKKSYVLGMFPYPSGEGLHTGHGRIFTACDVLARHQRMSGYDVLLPMGWDGFGLPAENAAIKAKTNPMKMVPKNEANFKRQMQMLGFSYDWNREFSTTDPDYYKWTQWLFLKLYSIKNKQGKRLIYREEVPINWCTQCKTGLANEEVLSDGTHERCGKPVGKKLLPQWVMRITDYADELLMELDTTKWTDADGAEHTGLDWPKGILEMQRNWIGKKEGVDVQFRVKIGNSEKTIKTFTTRVDTVFGVTFVVVAPEIAKRWLDEGWQASGEVQKYIETALNKTEQQRMEEEKQKTGVDTGLVAINPVNGAAVPIYVADYVLADVGTGAVMGVPGGDERDFEFAAKFQLPIIRVVRPPQAQEFKSYLMGADEISDEDLKKIGVKVVKTEESGSRQVLISRGREEEYERLVSEKMTPGFWNEYLGDEVVFLFKHKDGKVERLVLHQGQDERIAQLAEEFTGGEIKRQMPIWAVIRGNEWYRDEALYEGYGELVNSGEFNGLDSEEALKVIPEKFKDVMDKSVSYHLRDWVFSRQRYWGEPFPLVYCEKCADKADKYDVYEIDDKKYAVVPVADSELPVTLPELDYYEPTDTGESPLSRVAEWVNTTCPDCGGPARRETDTMPNWAGSCWYFIRFAMQNGNLKSQISNLKSKEPAAHLEEKWQESLKDNPWLPVQWYLGGAEHAVLHLLYARFWVKAFNDLGLLPFREPFLRLRSVGMVLAEDGRKMSKSLGNIVNPDTVVEQFGADAVRIYEMFMGPWDQSIAWDTTSLVGCKRFLDKVWRLYQHNSETAKQTIEGKIGGQTSSNMVGIVQRTIKKVGEDIAALKFNTAIASLMELVNAWREEGTMLSREDAGAVLKLLAPFAPFMAEELYQKMQSLKDPRPQGESQTYKEKAGSSIHQASWPTFDPAKIVEETITIPVQINGKLRATLTIQPSNHETIEQAAVVKLALEHEKVKPWLVGKSVVKHIWVPGKLVNLVVK